VRIIKYPHPVLRHKSKPLRRVDRELKTMIGRMFELMYEHNGLGLAANQVELPYRLFIINVSGDPQDKGGEMVFINPVITDRQGSAEDREGCLSFPEIYAPVRRSAKIVITGFSASGEEVTYQLTGMQARAAQHEADHLDGVLFIDRLTPSHLASIRSSLDELELEHQGNQRLGLIAPDPDIAARVTQLELART
jgi:peptide deformylase